MNQPFPFGFPFPTAAYLTLYVLTLIVHVVFMNYVLAGTAYLAVVSIFTGGPGVLRQKTPMALVLRDWMPFALGAAITAGVAPLLFIQILYQKNFYTANLLLFHRWMSVLPVLIVGFYLLYVLKSRTIGGWPALVRGAVGVDAFLAIAFTGYSWTENHLLSTDSGTWPDFYAAGRMVYFHPELIPRLAVWFVGAVPTWCALVSWQLWYNHRHGDRLPEKEARRAAVFALWGLGLSAVCGLVYYLVMDAPARDAVTGWFAAPYLVLVVIGLIIEALTWRNVLRAEKFSAKRLALITLGRFLALIGAAVLREAVRLSRVDVATYYDHHAEAARVGGFAVFAAFLLINAVLVAWCVVLVRRGQRVAAAE